MKFTKEDPKEHFFYGAPVIRREEKEYIEKILSKHRGEKATEELKEKIWNELQMEKAKGNILIPFKVVIRRGLPGNFPDYIEIILDTKV